LVRRLDLQVQDFVNMLLSVSFIVSSMKIKVIWISKTDYLTWWDDLTWRYKLLLTSYLMTVIKLHCFINENTT
jgi:hypothetical protein